MLNENASTALANAIRVLLSSVIPRVHLCAYPLERSRYLLTPCFLLLTPNLINLPIYQFSNLPIIFFPPVFGM